MRRGTAPILTFTLPFETADLKKVWVTFSQRNREIFTIEKEDCELSGNIVQVTLTQKQTLSLVSDCEVEIQLRTKDAYGVPLASNIMVTDVERILKDGEI